MSMDTYRIRHTDFNTVSVTYQESLWMPEHDARKVYDSLLADEDTEDLFNGSLVRVRNMETVDDRLWLTLEDTDYFSHVATRDAADYTKVERADPLSTGIRLVTADDKMVLGERHQTEHGQGAFQIPAGYVTPPENPEDWDAYLRDEACREAVEELNVPKRTYEDTLEPIQVLEATTYQPMLMYDATTTETADAVAELWGAMPDENREFSSLAFLPADDPGAAARGDQELHYAELAADGDVSFWTVRESLPLRPQARCAVDTYR